MNFEKLFKREFGRLGGLIGTLVPEADDVEVIVREAFARLWDKRDMVVQPEAVEDFLENAALSGAVRYMVDNRRAAGEKPATGQLQQVVAALPTHARAVFVLARERALNFADIGEMLDLSPETVAKQLGKALRLVFSGMTGNKMPESYALADWSAACEAVGKTLADQVGEDDAAADAALLAQFRPWWEAAGDNRPALNVDADTQWQLFIEVVPEAEGGKIVDKAALRKRKKLIRKWGIRLLMLAVATAIAMWIVL